MKKVIYLKDLPSNILKEAIFVLNDNKCINYSNTMVEEARISNAISEAEYIIEDYINKCKNNKKTKNNIFVSFFSKIKNKFINTKYI